MSKSITEKELAETLREECDINRHNGWNHAARRIAEALGVTLTPEKPEPGTWHVVAEGPRKGYAAVVQQNGVLVMFNEHGDGYRREPDEDWPDLTPARVVAAEPVELSEEEVGELWDAANISRHGWESYSGVFHEQVTATVNAALAKHGHGRVEVSAGQVDSAVRSGMAASKNDMLDRFTLEDRITSAIMELLEGSK